MFHRRKKCGSLLCCRMVIVSDFGSTFEVHLRQIKPCTLDAATIVFFCGARLAHCSARHVFMVYVIATTFIKVCENSKK